MSTTPALYDTVSKTKTIFTLGIDRDQEIKQWHPKLKYCSTYRFKDFKGWRRMGLTLTMFMSLIPKFKILSRILVYNVIH